MFNNNSMKKYCVLIFLIGMMLVSCEKDKQKPTVVTNEVVTITATTADVVADVTDDGGAEVTKKGVCWSINQNPSVADNYTDNGKGVGSFTSNLKELNSNTTYYVRAYATNEVGTSYGEQISFSTLEESNPDDDDDDNGDDDNDNGDDDNGDDEIEVLSPEVTTLSVTEITETSAVAGGDVTSDGGAEVTARGVCWSVNPNPTMDDKHTEDGTGVGQFVSNLPNLAINTTYYLRAYATNEVGTSYGEEVTFTTLEGNFINGYEYVDLGLPSGLKWATHNFGATMPYEIGEYLAWGEHKGKDMYSISNSETYGVNIADFSGDIEYDAAAFTWGGTWRIPTEAETRELKDNCTFEWTEMNGVPGAIVTGPNGNSIFLPSGGFATEGNIDFVDSEGAYWTSSPDPSDPMYYACFFYFYNTNFSNIGWFSKYAGLLVRPVAE